MKTTRVITGFALAVFALCGAARAEERDAVRQNVKEITYRTPEGKRGFIFGKDAVLTGTSRVPMVVMMMCTSGEARQNAIDCGWVDFAGAEDIIVLAPDYNNYATYSEIATIMSSVNYAIANYPVDTTRVYATGFSNGGAMAVALASRETEHFAAISSYGWMVDMRGGDAERYDMPFQVIQGSEEFTVRTSDGSVAVMDDEKEAIRSLMLFNGMITGATRADYRGTPYWGYKPDAIREMEADGTTWTVNDYYKEGFGTTPFAQFVLVDGERHVPHKSEAQVSWDFFKRFSRRASDGAIVLAE